MTSGCQSSMRLRFWYTASAVPSYHPSRARLRRNDAHKTVGQPSNNLPALAQVFDQGLRAVLDEHVQRCDVRIHEVAEHEIDDAIFPSEGYGRFTADFGQRQ